MSKKPRDPVEVLKAELVGETEISNRFNDLVQEYGLLMANENAPDDVVRAQNLRRDEIIQEVNALPLTHPAELEVRLYLLTLQVERHLLALQVERHLPEHLLITRQIKDTLAATADALKAMHDIKPLTDGGAS